MLHSPLVQLPVGFGIGVLSALAPTLLRPLISAGFLLVLIQSAILFNAGGTDALLTGLGWIVAFVQSGLLAVAGIGIGRWLGEIVKA